MDRERANSGQVTLIKRRVETDWQNMTINEKAVDFTARHQFSTIAGCWALGISGAFGAIMRNPYVGKKFQKWNKLTEMADRYQSLSQKVLHL